MFIGETNHKEIYKCNLEGKFIHFRFDSLYIHIKNIE